MFRSTGVAFLLSLAGLGALAGCTFEAGTEEASSATLASDTLDTASSTPGLGLSVHTTLGIPEEATPSDPRHALVVKPQYVVSFDTQRKNPRWTSWELTTRWLGTATRSPSFSADHDLPSSFAQATNSDYSNSGFQRGHICPSADRTKSQADNLATFVFTNAVPQTAESNTGSWESLERDERTLTQQGHHLFVIAGSMYEGATRTIGHGVSVPSSMFKVVVVMDGDRPTPSEVTSSTRVITVEIPNDTTAAGNYKRYRVKFADIERKTGFQLLSDVPASVHDALAARVDTQ